MHNLDIITIKNLRVFAHHGVFIEEKENGQDFFVSASLYIDTYDAINTDDINNALNYGEVCEYITKILSQKSYNLIEAAAENTIFSILKHFPQIQKIDFELSKPHAPVGLPFENISVKMTRMWHKAYIALGSNMGDSKLYIEEAINSMKNNTNIKDINVSNLIITKPYGYTQQPDFLNCALCLYTLYTPHQLLSFLQTLETNAKRVRDIHWGPRTLDLDILFFDNLTMHTKDLIIPHPEIEKREFVLAPMNELNPYLIHPLLGKSIKELLFGLRSE